VSDPVSVALLAVDGGNSKTDAALVAEDGRVLGLGRGIGSSQHEKGVDPGLDVIADIIRAACADARVDPSRLPVARFGLFCLAGADLPSDDRRLARAIGRRGWTERDLVRNDTFAVLRAGTDRGWGVAVVCGAGINCVGVAPDGRVVRFFSLGEISGDWGGGDTIGMAALGAAVRGRDGRGPRTMLEELVPAHFGLSRPGALVEAIHFGRVDEDRLRELPPVVFAAAREGDGCARAIIERLGDEVTAMAGAAIRRLRMARMEVEVVLGGGLFRNDDPVLVERIRDGVLGIARLSRITPLTTPPLAGAILLGLDRLGADGAAAQRVRAAITHDRLSRNGETAGGP
jgi:N-acetylglucosamine kinase-like BadF-type ATPase